MWLKRKRRLLVLLKSISQMYAEEVKSLPLAKNGRVDPLETSRLKAKLHVRFWQPIAEMLDPRDRCVGVGGAAQDFYSRGPLPLRPDEMEMSHRLMKNYLGVARLSFGSWLRLQPIFKNALAQALTHGHRDLVVCAVRQFVRLELGEAPEPGYGAGCWIEDDSDRLNDEYCGVEDEPWLFENASEHMGIHEMKEFVWVQEQQACFNDPIKFTEKFPRMGHRRLNMAHALGPIFESEGSELIGAALDCADALLAITFEENRLPSKPAERTAVDEAAGLPPAPFDELTNRRRPDRIDI
jgi:hypothetical protein